MTNEKKANEIARDKLPYNNAEYHDCYNSAIKAMQWKEEQIFDLLRSEVLSAHLHGGEIDEVLAELDEKMKGE